jgi:hypothetical protein
LFITNEAPESMLFSIYGGNEDQDNTAVVYDDSQEIVQFAFNASETTTPKIVLSKYKNKLAN